ncbi:Fic family protein [Pedobacter frigidisoli]|uniref:Fic family protein n=1 Tax=Pedobacter frigidisoli TaxID=2530455 RepID=UPI00292CC9F1|nr:Fic family protein [Pedobacter frigidisoli]
MKKLESAPLWYKEPLYTESLKLSKSDEVTAMIDKINDGYLYWDKVKHYDAGIRPDQLWARVKASRVINAKKLAFGSHKFLFNLTNTIQKQLHEFDLHIGGNLGANRIIPEADKKRYLVSSIMEEAIASSQIEGAVTTRKKAKEMLRKSAKPRNTSEQMILNNYITINHIVKEKDDQLTLDKLFEIHRLIVKDTMDEEQDEGRFRDNNDIRIVDSTDGEVVHFPPDHSLLKILMAELIDFCNDKHDEQFIHPIIKGCIIHFMIGYIHPFVDGNGRTARALFYWYLLKKGYWLTVYLSISRLIYKSKVKYAKAFLYTETDDNDLTYFIAYKLNVMQMSFKELKDYIQRKMDEKRQMSDFQKIRGINERQATILKWISEDPDSLLTVKELENRLLISNQTARTDLEGLVKMGYLEVIELNRKMKGFCKSENFDQLLNKHLS